MHVVLMGFEFGLGIILAGLFALSVRSLMVWSIINPYIMIREIRKEVAFIKRNNFTRTSDHVYLPTWFRLFAQHRYPLPQGKREPRSLLMSLLLAFRRD